MTKTKLAAALMGLMVSGAVAAPASAALLVGPDVVVHYADLDIRTEAGAEKLYERIQQAAARVCPKSSAERLSEYAAVVRCRNNVVADAVSSVRSPRVTAVYATRGHHWVRSPA